MKKLGNLWRRYGDYVLLLIIGLCGLAASVTISLFPIVLLDVERGMPISILIVVMGVIKTFKE